MSRQPDEKVVTRREFFRITGIAGVGLVIQISLSGCGRTSEQQSSSPAQTRPSLSTTATSTPTGQTPTPSPQTTLSLSTTATSIGQSPPLPSTAPVSASTLAALTKEPEYASWQPGIYAILDTSGAINIKAFRSELGQGISTALAMVVAEELDADWSSVSIEHVGANSAYGNQVTGGSVSVSGNYNTLRKAGAGARQLLVSAAARRWSVEPGACRTEQGAVIHPDGKTRLFYGQLVSDASQLDPSKASNAPLKDSATFKIIGTTRSLYYAPSQVRGDPLYAIDVSMPGLLYAVVARCPVAGGKAGAFDGSKASAVPGVQRVVQVDSGIAVVADNTWAALRGRDALQITWNEGALSGLSSASIREGLVKSAPSLDTGSALTFKAAYDIPFLATAALEPMNCTADVRSDRCEIWAPTQAPQAVKQTAQSLTHLPDAAVVVHAPPAGGAFGGRHVTDYVQEAVQLSQATRTPVKVMWTRDDDLQYSYYHPLSYNYMESTLNAAGLPASLPSNRSFASRSGIRTNSWRSVGEFTNAFARESFLDEVAARSKLDPLAMRLKLVPAQGQQVLQLAADKAGWSTPLPGGQGRGLAYWACWNVTHVAEVVEVAVAADGSVRVPRVVCAVDCGQVINPDTVAQQMEGAVIFGLTAAPKACITIDKGRTQQRSFVDYPLINIIEAPTVEVYTVPGAGRSPTGMGEPGVPPLAPAVANAIFAATGIRVRHVPIRPEDLRRS